MHNTTPRTGWTLEDWYMAIYLYQAYQTQLQNAAAIKAQMVGMYGQETVDAVSALALGNGIDTTYWSADYWEEQIGEYLRAKWAENRYSTSSITLPIYDNKVNNQIPVEDYLEIRGKSLKNENSEYMTLGKYLRDEKTGEVLPEAYTEMAKKYGDTYFDLGTEWDVIKEKYGLTNEDMFELFNVPALDYAVEKGTKIRFSQDPRLKKYENTSLADEWNHLKSKYGYTELRKEGDYWYAIK